MNITIADRFKAAGNELLKANFGNVIKSFTIQPYQINPGTYRTDDFSEGFWFFGREGCDKHFEYKDSNSSLIAYSQCPTVAAVLNRKTQAYANGTPWILNTQGKGRDNEAKGAYATKLKKLLNNPNPRQTGLEFQSQCYFMTQLFGCAIGFLDKPFGFPAIEADSMWILPNWMVKLYLNDEQLFFREQNPIKRVTITQKGKEIDLPVENIFFLKDFTPSLNTAFFPLSRIEPISMAINNVIGAYESRNVLIRRRGPMFIVSNGAGKDQFGQSPMSPDEKAEVEHRFSNRYGALGKQLQALVTSASINVQTVGYDVGQLKLHEEVRESAVDICAGLSYPPFLLGLSDSTYNNQAEASRGLYMETIIPEANNIDAQWNTLFDCAANNITISRDFDHVSALQEDKRNAAQARRDADTAYQMEFVNNIITLNEWRMYLGEDKRTDEFGDKYYHELLKLGWQFGNTKPATDAGPAGDNPLMQAV